MFVDGPWDDYHARVQEGVAKSQFPLKGSRFQKRRPRICAVLKGFTPCTTLAWLGLRGCGANLQGGFLGRKVGLGLKLD